MKKKKFWDAETGVILRECNRMLMAVGENPLDDYRRERRQRRQKNLGVYRGRKGKSLRDKRLSARSPGKFGVGSKNRGFGQPQTNRRMVFREQIAKRERRYDVEPVGEEYVTVIAIVRFIPENSKNRNAVPRLLLVKNRGRSGASFPGGHIQPEETLEHAVVREVAEETGVDIEGAVKKLGRRKVGPGAYMAVFTATVPWDKQAELLPAGGPEQEWCGTKTAAEIDQMAADGRLMQRNHKPIWEFYRRKFADELQ